MVLALALTVNAQSVATQKHEMQSGETLYSIARQYNVQVKALMDMNPELDPDHIMAGQKINVPATQQNNVSVPVVDPQQQVVTPNRPRYKTLHEVK